MMRLQDRKKIADCFVTGEWSAEDDAFKTTATSDDEHASSDEDSDMSGNDDSDVDLDSDDVKDDVDESSAADDDTEAHSTLRVVGQTDDELKAEREAKKRASKDKRGKMRQMFSDENDKASQHYKAIKEQLGEQAEVRQPRMILPLILL